MTTTPRKRKRTNLGLLALEPRWMFDGAAAHAALDPTARALIPNVPAPVEVRAANPAQDGGKLEVVFVDTALANYKTLEAAVKPGVGIEEIAGGVSGLAQMAVWAETHSGYDSIALLSPNTEARVAVGTDTIIDSSLTNATTSAELGEIGSALKAGGDLLLYGDNVGNGADGRQFVTDLAGATGANVAAFTDPTDATGADGAWEAQIATGTITANGPFGDAAALAATPGITAPVEVRAADPSLDGGKTEAVFIDTSVANYQTLEAAIGPGVEIDLIGGGQDGLAQMAVWGLTHSGYDAVHVLSHGDNAEIVLGTATITDSALANPAVQAEWAAVGGALKPGGDLLVYACDVAAGPAGRQFLSDLAADSGRVVAGSTDDTGAAALGGNWTLEATTGPVEAAALSLPGYDGLLGSLTASGFTTNGSITTIQTIDPFANVTISDTVSGDTPSATISFTAADGTLNGTGLSAASVSGGIATYTLAATTSATLQSELRALVFTPTLLSTTTAVDFTLNLAGSSLATLATSFNELYGVAVDSAGDVFVANQATNAVDEIHANGTVTTLATGLNYPQGVTVDGSGDVFVTNAGTGTVSEIHANGTVTTFATGLGDPWGVAVDSAGDVFVANYTGGSVEEIHANGTVTTLAIGFVHPSGVAVDSVGDVFVTTINANTVDEIHANGSVTTLATGFSVPEGVAVDSAGDVFVANYGNGTVSEIHANDSVTTLATGLGAPMAVALDSVGDVFVVNYGGVVSEIYATAPASFTDSTTQVTLTPVAPAVTAVAYSATAGTLTLSGSAFTGGGGFVFTDLTVKGEGGASYTLTGGTLDASSTTSSAVIDLDAADKTALAALFNKNGTSAPDGTVYGLNATAGWDGSLSTALSGYSQGVTASGIALSASGFTTNGSISTIQTIDPFANVTISDGVSGDTPSATISFTAADGTLSGSGLSGPTINSGTATYTLAAATAATLQSELRALVFTPAVLSSTTNVGFSLSLNTSALITLGSGFSYPHGVAVDSAGDVFIADTGNNTVKEIHTNGVITTLASGLNSPEDVAVDSAGDVFVADTYNSQVKEIHTNGVITTLGSGFSDPSAVAVDSAGDVFVADTANNAVKEIHTNGVITILGSGFSSPQGVAVDSVGNVFVGDYGNNQVKEIHTNGVITTLGSGFSGPWGITLDSAGDVFVNDMGTATAKEIHTNGVITTLASGFSNPEGVAVDSAGDVFIADADHSQIKEIPAAVGSFTDTTTQVTLTAVAPAISAVSYSATAATLTLSGSAFTGSGGFVFTDLTVKGEGGASYTLTGGTLDASSTISSAVIDLNAADKTALAALFNKNGASAPDGTVYGLNATAGWDGSLAAALTGYSQGVTASGIALSASGFTTTGAITTIQTIDPFANVTISDGVSGDTPSATISFTAADGALSGTGLSAASVSGGVATYTLAAATPATLQSELRALVFTPTVLSTTTAVDFTLQLAGSGLGTVSTLATGFSGPECVAVDGVGDIFITNTGNNTVSEIHANGTVTTLATGFSTPQGVAVDAAGDVFVADFNNNAVKEIHANGSVTTLATGLNQPWGVAVDGGGNVFVANYGNNTVSEIHANGSVTTLATGFSSPAGVAVDSAGDVFVANAGNNTVSEIHANGSVTTLATGFSSPRGVAVDSAGDVFVANVGSGVISEIHANGSVTTLAGGLSGPNGVAVDSAGDVFVANHSNATVDEVRPPVGFTDTTTQVTLNPVAPSVSAVAYSASAGTLTLSGSAFTGGGGFVFTDLTVKGEGGASYTLTGGALDSSSTSTSAVIDLNAADKTALAALFNKNGTSAPDGTAYGLNATAGWDGSLSTALGGYSQGVTVSGESLTASGFTTNGTTSTIQTIDPFASITISDSITGDTPSATISFTAADGALSGTGLSAASVSGGVATYTLAAATPATLQSELRALVFTPTVLSTTTAVDFTLHLAGSGIATVTGFSTPVGVAVDSAGDVFVANYLGNTVSEIHANGSVTTLATGFTNPQGVAVDSAGDVFVANGTVSEIHANGSVTTLATGFSDPWGVAVDSAGDVFVADYGNNTVKEIHTNGTVSVLATGFSGPVGLAVDNAGDVFVANGGNGTVSEIHANGSVTTFATGFSTPEGLAMDSAGDVFVANQGTNTVSEIHANGSVTTLATGFSIPQGVAVDSAGDVFVANLSTGTVSDILANPGSFTDTTTQVTLNPVAPAITTVAYSATAGTLTLSGSAFTGGGGFVLTDLTVKGEGGASYTLTGGALDSSSTSTSAVIDLNAADKTALAALFNKNGTSAPDGTTYGLNTSAGWDGSLSTALTGYSQGVTVSGDPLTASGFTTNGLISTLQTIDPFANVTISDSVTGDTPSATISFTAADGTLSGTGLSAGSVSGGIVTYTKAMKERLIMG